MNARFRKKEQHWKEKMVITLIPLLIHCHVCVGEARGGDADGAVLRLASRCLTVEREQNSTSRRDSARLACLSPGEENPSRRRSLSRNSHFQLPSRH